MLRLPRKVTHELHQMLRLPREVTHELHQMLRLPRKVTHELHQMLHVPRKMNLMIDPHHIWNVIYNARSNSQHPPTSPNIAPATQNDHPTSDRNLLKTAETWTKFTKTWLKELRIQTDWIFSFFVVVLLFWGLAIRGIVWVVYCKKSLSRTCIERISTRDSFNRNSSWWRHPDDRMCPCQGFPS